MAERESGRTLPCDPPAQRWPPAPALSPRPRRVLCLVGVGREEEAGAWRKGRGAGRKPGKGSSFCPSGSSTPPPPAWTSGPLIPPGGPGAPGSGPSSPSPLQTPGLSASMLRPTPPGPLHRRLAGALPTAWSPYCSLTHQQSFTDGSSKPGQGLSWCWIYKNKQSYPQGAPGSVGR